LQFGPAAAGAAGLPRPRICAATPFALEDDDTDSDAEPEEGADTLLDVPAEVLRREALLAQAPMYLHGIRIAFAEAGRQLERQCGPHAHVATCRALADGQMDTCLKELHVQVAAQRDLLRCVQALEADRASAALLALPMEALRVPLRLQVSSGRPYPTLSVLPKPSAVLTRTIGRGTRKFGVFGRFLLSVRGVDGRQLPMCRSYVSVTGDMQTCSVLVRPSGVVEITYLPGQCTAVRFCVAVHGQTLVYGTALAAPRAAPSGWRLSLLEALQTHLPPVSGQAKKLVALVAEPVASAVDLAARALRFHFMDASVRTPAVAVLYRCAQRGLFCSVAQINELLPLVLAAVAQGKVLGPDALRNAKGFVDAVCVLTCKK